MKKFKTGLLLFTFSLLITIFVLQNCKKKETENNQPTVNTTPYQFPNIPWFPTKMNIPADNPTTVEGVALGRYLFYDTRWTGRVECDSQMSCCSCHIQKNAFVCGNDRHNLNGHPYGTQGLATPHIMLPLINEVYNFNGYAWTGAFNEKNISLGSAALGVPARYPFDFKNIEGVVWFVLYVPVEAGSDSTRALAALNRITSPDYKTLFKTAFGTDQIRMELIQKAIAQFVRTLISYQSKYDSVVHMHLGHFTPSEARGYQIYFLETGDCFHCHGEPALLTNNLFLNNGLDSDVMKLTDDRYSYTNDPNDRGAYKVPTLRNIALTAPYMRDGRFSTLQEVVDFYASGVNNTPYTHPLMKWAFQHGNHLDDYQKQDLIAFLKTFTDYTFIHNPVFGKPPDLDTKCP